MKFQKFTLTIITQNAAFTDYGYEEVARLLRKAADEIAAGVTEVPLMDINVNKVGTAYFEA